MSKKAADAIRSLSKVGKNSLTAKRSAIAGLQSAKAVANSKTMISAADNNADGEGPDTKAFERLLREQRPDVVRMEKRGILLHANELDQKPHVTFRTFKVAHGREVRAGAVHAHYEPEPTSGNLELTGYDEVERRRAGVRVIRHDKEGNIISSVVKERKKADHDEEGGESQDEDAAEESEESEEEK